MAAPTQLYQNLTGAHAHTHTHTHSKPEACSKNGPILKEVISPLALRPEPTTCGIRTYFDSTTTGTERR